MKKKLFILLMLFTLLLCGCEKKGENKLSMEKQMPTENPIVTMSIKDYGDIKIELYPEYAFNTVANFVNLIENGFYNNNYINRVQAGFVIQGGAGKEPTYSIKGEFIQNGYFKNTLEHTKGVISMARTSDPDSAGGQFFIVLDDQAASSLDGMYAGFGKVIEGMDVIEKIGAKDDFKYTDDYRAASMGFLADDEFIYIEKTTVDTKGFTYTVEKN